MSRVFLVLCVLVGSALCLGACRERRTLELPDPEAQEETQVSAARSDVRRGERLFVQLGCPACHTIHGAPLVGPPLDRLAGRTRKLVGGGEVVADAEYLRESIYDPGAKVVEGFENQMPSYDRMLDDEAMDALVEYLLLLAR